MLKAFLKPRWILTTLLVIAGVGVLIRLGIWQLDRLAQRRAFNARITAQLNAPALDLSSNLSIQGLFDMEYRSVTVTGEYDLADQVMLRNQVWQDQPGVHLLTPLRITGSSQAILVDRGWVPFTDAESGKLSQYDEKGQVKVQGVIRRPQSRTDFGRIADPTLAPGQKRLDAFNLVNLDMIRQQVDLALLPVYIQQAPDPAWEGMPYRSQPTLDLSEGPHFGYAIQWFTFALILGAGYPFYVRRQLGGKPAKKAKITPVSVDGPQPSGETGVPVQPRS